MEEVRDTLSNLTSRLTVYLMLLEHTLGGLLFIVVVFMRTQYNRQFAMSFKTKLEPNQ